METLESILNCPVCLELPIKIVVCRRGHSVCENCSSKMDNCPICRGLKSSIRNSAIEKIVPFALACDQNTASIDLSCKVCKSPLSGHIFIRDDGFNYCSICFLPIPVRNYLAEAVVEKLREMKSNPTSQPKPIQDNSKKFECPFGKCEHKLDSLLACTVHMQQAHSIIMKTIPKHQFYTLKLKDKDQSGENFVIFDEMIFTVHYKLDKKNKRIFINPVPLLPEGRNFKIIVNHGSLMRCNTRPMAKNGLIIKTNETYDNFRRIHNISVFFFS
ncbi:unnamed protein product [Brassicogethes aeneus]|uniref:RING-type domain-containing protein n=1 Tax=Brassicogethes aeneus TaxID=1431903 RepID=A0A9P0BBI3_BRAAE|nr:unnamed protein product [Brassicogethes aeneus]